MDDSTLVGTNDKLAVIAVLYEEGDTCNADLDAFWEALPMSPGTAPYGAEVDLQAMLAPLLAAGYYSWSGSLTTPPCTEGVVWNLLKQRSAVCKRQIDRLKASLTGMRAGVAVNNRITQPINERVVRVTSTPHAADAQQNAAPKTVGVAAGVVLIAMGVALFGETVWRSRFRWDKRPSGKCLV